MSWKSLVFVGLLCIVASQVTAAPTVTGVGSGTAASGNLDANGNWVWTIQIARTAGLDTPLGAELGFTTTGTSDDIVGTASNSNPGVWDEDNPGNQIPIFGWEVNGPSNFPEGVQTETIANDGKVDEVFSALGSDVITTDTPQDHVSITVERPTTPNGSTPATTTINLVGAYSGNGRIAELDDPGNPCGSTSCNYDIYTNSITRQAFGGDSNLDGVVNIADYSPLEVNYLQPGVKRWQDGDYNGDSTVNIADYSQLEVNYQNISYSVLTDGTFATGGGAGGVAVAAVPEPASAVLMLLAGALLAAVKRRRR